MDSPTTLRERKKQATRDRLLEVAQELFVERGYTATSIDEIAARADVSRATVFNYFARKEEFLHAWVAGRRALIARLLTDEQDESMDTAALLDRAIMALGESLEADPDVNRGIARAWVHAGGPLLPGASVTAELFAETIRIGQSRGDIRRDIDAQLAGRVLLDAYLGALVRWAAETESTPPSLSEALRTVLDLLLDGLRPTRSGRR
jgi:AcrR family transcriptional regulator